MVKFFILFFISAYLVSAQGGNSGQGSGVDDVRSFSSNTSGVWINNSNTINEIIGTPFLLENWSTISVISTENGKRYKLKGLNYDVVLDRMVAKISNDSVYSFDALGIKEVKLGSLIFKRFLDPEYNLIGFFEVISKNNNKILLKKYSKEIRDGVFNPMTQKESPSKYLTEVDYFITDSSNLLKKVPTSNRKLINFLIKNKSSDLQKFISVNKLSAKKENDLILIFDYATNL